MPARKRTAERLRQERRRVAEEVPLTPAQQAEDAWLERELERARVRDGHCPCGFGVCCYCGTYGLDGPRCT